MKKKKHWKEFFLFEKYLFFTTITALIVLMDQWFKTIAIGYPLGVSKKLIDGILFFTHVHNYGASFGILKNHLDLLVWFSIFVIVIIFAYLAKLPKKITPFVALILGGTVSNLIDRINYGFVVDYLDIKIWPAFNIADMMITLGAIVVIIWILKEEKGKK